MHNTFVGSEPAELRVLGELTGKLSEVRHQIFDFAPDQAGPEHFGSLANQLVAPAESKCDSGTEYSIRRCKERGRKGILGTGMDRVSTRATFEGKPDVASFERNDAFRYHE